MIKKCSCSVCKEINQIKHGDNPYYVITMSTGYVVLGKYQFFRGYTLFLCKIHATELHELPKSFQRQFLSDMSIVAKAVYQAFKPKKLNYELLGNTDPHLHWHIFPRYKNDPLPNRPIWCIDRSLTMSESVRPSIRQLSILKNKLAKTIRGYERA